MNFSQKRDESRNDAFCAGISGLAEDLFVFNEELLDNETSEGQTPGAVSDRLPHSPSAPLVGQSDISTTAELLNVESMAPSTFVVGDDQEGREEHYGLAAVLLSHTPQGVVTKVECMERRRAQSDADRFQRPVVGRNLGRAFSTEKRLCSLCFRNAFCVCPSCAAEKCDFFKKRTRQTVLEAEKRQSEAAINEFLNSEIQLIDQLSDQSIEVGHLRELVKFKRHRVERLKRHVEASVRKQESSSKYIQKLTDLRLAQKDEMRKRRSVICGLEERYRAKFAQLKDLRQCMARTLFDLLPISVDVSGPSMGNDEKGSTSDGRASLAEALAEATSTCFVDDRWTVVAAQTSAACSSSPAPVRVYQVVRCCLNEDEDYVGLKDGILKPEFLSNVIQCRSRGRVREAFGALGYSMQLVRQLAVVNDLCLPFMPCYRDLALETRWSSALFETDLFKLDVSAVLLCLSYGCPSGILILQRPLRNMFALSDFLKHSSASLRSPITPMELSDEIHGRLSQFEWTDHEQRSRRRPQSSSLTTEEWQLVCGDELPNVADFYETKPTDLTEYLLRSVNSFFGSRS